MSDNTDMRDFAKKATKGGIVVSVAIATRFATGLLTQLVLAWMLDAVTFGIIAFASVIILFLNDVINFHGDKFAIHHQGDERQALNTVFTIELLAAEPAVAKFVAWIRDKPDGTSVVSYLSNARRRASKKNLRRK